MGLAITATGVTPEMVLELFRMVGCKCTVMIYLGCGSSLANQVKIHQGQSYFKYLRQYSGELVPPPAQDPL